MPAYLVVALASGALFGGGLAVSHMVDPAKILGFLDVAGGWDPSLAFVMGGAVAVTAVAFPLVLRRPHPLGVESFSVSAARAIDGRLVGGAGLFGCGLGPRRPVSRPGYCVARLRPDRNGGFPRRHGGGRRVVQRRSAPRLIGDSILNSSVRADPVVG